MRRITLAAMLIAMSAAVTTAQIKTIPGETVTRTGTIESIERGTRQVTLKKENGEYVTITVPTSVTRFDALKVGDKVTAKYYDNVVVRVKAPGEKSVDTATSAVTPGSNAKPGGTSAAQRTITATITHIDPKVPSITFKGPNNWTYSSRVQDKEALAKVKVGDQVDITWTEALMIGVEAPTAK